MADKFECSEHFLMLSNENRKRPRSCIF